LLAAGPRLAGIQPNNSVLFSFEDASANVRNAAPKELNIRFDEDQQIDATTLDAIRISRSGADGIFGTVDDVQIDPSARGFIGVTPAPNQNELLFDLPRICQMTSTVSRSSCGVVESVEEFARRGFRPHVNG